MNKSYIGWWIVRIDGYHMIIEQRMRNKHQNADSLSMKTEFYGRLEQKQANQAEIKEGFSFLDKETYEALSLTRWLDKSGHPIPGHPELPVEKAAGKKDLIKKGPGGLWICCYVRTWSNRNSLACTLAAPHCWIKRCRSLRKRCGCWVNCWRQN